jgi:hypothetical protein
MTAVFRATLTPADSSRARDGHMSTYESRQSHYDTLADCYRSHVDVVAICEVEAHRCYRSATLDLVALILKHGDLSLSDLRGRLVCKVCGRRSYRLKILHQAGPGNSKPPRELPPAAKKRLLANAIARGTGVQRAGGMKQGRDPLSSGRLFGSLSGWLLCSGCARPVAFVAFAGLRLGFGTLPPIGGQGSADIVGFNKGCAKFVAADVALIGAGIDELALGHD